jgi:hypothetical protein
MVDLLLVLCSDFECYWVLLKLLDDVVWMGLFCVVKNMIENHGNCQLHVGGIAKIHYDWQSNIGMTI